LQFHQNLLSAAKTEISKLEFSEFLQEKQNSQKNSSPDNQEFLDGWNPLKEAGWRGSSNENIKNNFFCFSPKQKHEKKNKIK
jgi:hypothetical protein